MMMGKAVVDDDEYTAETMRRKYNNKSLKG